MDTLFELLKIIVGLVISIVSLPFLIQLMFSTITYLLGYLYDSIFGDWLIKLAYHIARKCGMLRNKRWFRKIWSLIKPKNTNVRYETPIISYCFSYMAILLMAQIIPGKVNMTGRLLSSMALYIILYFIGMYRRCGKKSEYYTTVLNNNMSFLKLSFWVLGGLITGIGFVCTVLGKDIDDVNSLGTMIEDILMVVDSLFENSEPLMIVLIILVSFVSIFVVLYVASIPVQIVSYFIILLINYFRENSRGYAELTKRYWGRTKRFIGFASGIKNKKDKVC